MRHSILLFSICILLYMDTQAATYKVGPSRTYVSPNALYTAGVVNSGDTIEIDGVNYSGTATLANWQQNNLLIRGVNGRPHLQANGQYILGKGIWVLSGNNITVENVEFSGTTVPSENGAGIRLDGIGMTVRHCYFHDNENGILATSSAVDGVILVEYTEFEANGFGDGFTHNIYVNNADKLIFRFNYSHHAKVGHNLKSRADTNYVYCNRIMDEETGNSSRLIDIPNGGPAIVMGNLLMQGNNAPNNNLVGYGLEGLTSPTPHDLVFVNNTCVNKRLASCRFLQVQNGTGTVLNANNIFTGGGTILTGSPASTTSEGNLIDEIIANIKFVDEPSYDYHLEVGSPAIDAGEAQGSMHSFSLTPVESYRHKTQMEVRTLEGLKIDAGAYEQGVALPILLVLFHAIRSNEEVLLTWETGLEINNLGFYILRSSDGQQFDNLEWVGATGSGEGTIYDYVDVNPMTGTNYYRLKQVDEDGSEWESGIVAVAMPLKPAGNIFPNPVKEFLNLPQVPGRWTLLSAEGKILPMPIQNGEHLVVDHLIPGIYYLKAEAGLTFTFMKQ